MRLDTRMLNRALLDRQFLLARSTATVVDVLEHLVGMQAQAPLAPYVGLWSRLVDFDPAHLADLLRQRRAVRTHLMRSTIHLVTADDCLGLRPLMQPMIANGYARSPFARNLPDVDTDAVADLGRQLLAERPRSRAELGRLLAESWPGRDPGSLSAAVTMLVPAVQVTPRGVWGESGPVAWATIESWLGQPLPDSAPEPDRAVLRYLAAFGPATVADVRTWSGLTGLTDVVERLRPRLRTFSDENGRELFDLPDAPKPAADVPAPVRFLPEYDNVLLSHADRTRVNDQARPIMLAPGNGARTGAFLLDGFYRGVWTVDRKGDDRATLRITSFAPLPDHARAELAEEGEGLLGFLAAVASTYDIVYETS